MYRKEIPDGFPKNFLWGGATAANRLERRRQRLDDCRSR